METDVSNSSGCSQIRGKHFQTAKTSLRKAKDLAKHGLFFFFFPLSNFSLVQYWLLALPSISLPYMASYWHILRFQYLNPWLLLLILFTFQRSPQVWLFLSSRLLFWVSAVFLTYEASKVFPAQDKEKVWFLRCTFVNGLFHLPFLNVQEKLMC